MSNLPRGRQPVFKPDIDLIKRNGRPLQLGNGSKAITIRITDSEYAKLTRAAERRRVTRSDIVRWLIDERLA